MERTLLKILTCCSILLFFNCQNDDFIKEIDAHAHDNGIIINRISGQELKAKVPSVFKKAQSLNQTKNTDALARGVRIDEEYEVETDEVIEISKDGITHYTFSISRTVPTDLVENLVISVDADGILTGKIVTYDLTEEEKQAVALKNYVALTDKMNVKEVENINNVASLFMRKGLDCVTFVESRCPSGAHSIAEMLDHKCEYGDKPEYAVTIIVDVDCLNGGNSGGGTTNPTNPGTNPTNPGTGGGGGTTNPNPVITTPLLEVSKSLLPCAKLKKMSNSIPNYNQDINLLKNKAEGTKEYAWAYKYNSETNSFSPGTIVGDSQSNPNQVDLGDYLGGDYVGAAHNHLNPDLTGGIAMFSPGDIGWLFTCARKHNTNGQPKDYSLYFLLMVVEGRNYAIKITDAVKFQQNFNSMFPKIQKDLTEAYLKSTQYADAFTLQKDLLNVLKTHDIGVGLFEETDTNGTKEWSELTLNPLYPTANPIKKPCN